MSPKPDVWSGLCKAGMPLRLWITDLQLLPGVGDEHWAMDWAEGPKERKEESGLWIGQRAAKEGRKKEIRKERGPLHTQD